MKFLKLFLILMVGIFLLLGCSDDDNTGPDELDIEIFINEFMASNDYGPVDENGDHDDWIEIYNAGDEDVDIAGMYITDEIGDSTMTAWQIPSGFVETIIPAKGFLVLWADKEPDQGVLHIDLKLSGGGEDIAITDTNGSTVLDQLSYDEQTTDISYGRTPDGEDSWAFYGAGYANMPTPGTANGSGELPMAVFFINEFLASNDTCFADEHGDFDDWIEIYNGGNIAGDIGGMYVTDDLTDLMNSQIPTTFPDSTTIYPGEFLILWADKEAEQGILHIDDVKLSGDGEQIGLILEDGVTIVDSLTYGEQTTDVSKGRLPDGTDAWEFFTIPTPGASNE